MIVVGQPIAPARLRGSDRQVAWALRVRADLLPEIHDLRDGAAARLRTPHLTELEQQGYAAMLEAADSLIAEERAGFWIDMRGHSMHSLVAQRVEAARTAVAAEER
ncbi:MAG: hypothetical protein JOZ75_11905 [Candidatus Dormibacteraeota bacterium]|nr:hypothetical protein [Candidatus Dormibacteraeota bacterium]